MSATGRIPIDEDVLRSALRDAHGIDARTFEVVAEGADAAAWACRVNAADGRRWFLKLRAQVRPAAILVPRHLRDLGLEEVLASVPPQTGAPWLEVGSWSILVSPFIDAPTALRAGLDLDGWRRLGTFAARLHGVDLPAELRALIPVDMFRAAMTLVALAVDQHLTDVDPATLDAPATAVRRRWLDERATILRLVDAADALAERIRERDETVDPAAFVLCHADFHAGNILVGADGRLTIVDWDELMLAPPERDLMFVRGSAIARRVTDVQADAFEAGYGSARADPLLIAWYRIDWAVQDLAGFASEVLLDAGHDAAARDRARAFFEGQFERDGEVDTALEALERVGAG